MTIEGRRVHVRGVVQGVGFRPFVYRIAHQRGLAGYVRNLGDAGVEIGVAGSPEAIESFLLALAEEAPPLARLDDIEVTLAELADASEFVILPSTHEGAGGGQLPPDVAACDACVAEILGPSRFQGYWATSCTDCGPRFTAIESLPYDRPRTSMSEFPMCETCSGEYTNPLDRRYHAQTTACADCGPRLEFDGDPIDAITRAVHALTHGAIIAIKGIGGTHIACAAWDERAVHALRKRLGRATQPFALMASEGMLSTLVDASATEMEELCRPHRPILVLKKRAGACLDAVAPHLHTVGVMLPYSGLHHLLFESLEGPLVMTSANMPGQPMLIDNDDIMNRLQGVADHYLLHNRRIVARCDDSVRRSVAGKFVFLRRSRGFVPQGIDRLLGDESILALGPESDLTFALYDRGRVTLSQHIGNVDDLETLAFLRTAIEHMRRITSVRSPATIACDAHPQFLTTELAQVLAEEAGARVVRVQHHVAHFLSVMTEHELDDAVGIVVDGYGYGVDGGAWGGEILVADERVITRGGSLMPVRLPGGDLAAKMPIRMAASLSLSAGEAATSMADELIQRGLGRTEAELLIKQVESGINAPWTTSAGRFLDAVAAWLGVCRVRTYEGEPAMRLEAAAIGGCAQAIPVKIVCEAGLPRLDTVGLFAQLAQLSTRASIRDVAATAQQALAQGVATLAMKAASERGIGSIAISGGVAYNDHISSAIRDFCEADGLKVFTNQLVPSGDGGVALGQAAYAGLGYRFASLQV